MQGRYSRCWGGTAGAWAALRNGPLGQSALIGLSDLWMMKTINRIPHQCSSESSQNELSFLADSPHLIKNLKVALVNGQDITLPDWIINRTKSFLKYNDSQPLMYTADIPRQQQLKISPGLTTKTLTLSTLTKWKKCQNARIFFSHSNTARLEYLVQAHNHFIDLLTVQYRKARRSEKHCPNIWKLKHWP